MNFTICIPAWFVPPFVPIVLTYRKFRYGFPFRRIRLTEGKFAIVDPDDFEKLKNYGWYLSRDFYAYAHEETNGKRKTFCMHRKIMNPQDGFIIDHKNRNKLDNRKANLRPVTHSQNSSNKATKPHSSIYKGVSWNKGMKKWKSCIQHLGKYIHLGYFDDEVEAGKAYDQAAKKYHDQFAVLNFPNE